MSPPVCKCPVQGTFLFPNESTCRLPGAYGDKCISGGNCGLCVNNCGAGQNSNAGDVCLAYNLAQPPCGTSTVNANGGGGNQCSGTLICCVPVAPAIGAPIAPQSDGTCQ